MHTYSLKAIEHKTQSALEGVKKLQLQNSTNIVVGRGFIPISGNPIEKEKYDQMQEAARTGFTFLKVPNLPSHQTHDTSSQGLTRVKGETFRNPQTISTLGPGTKTRVTILKGDSWPSVTVKGLLDICYQKNQRMTCFKGPRLAFDPSRGRF